MAISYENSNHFSAALLCNSVPRSELTGGLQATLIGITSVRRQVCRNCNCSNVEASRAVNFSRRREWHIMPCP